ncbi:MAG: aminotransferase class I/II-fold pyridoxal phosphate-dependent enzyme, partial [Actinobacteria bacterium]|nr:aminotransferase class I/II-fold pyridoxal phosphate-dependent enzyme [Actinomycetota bacterium]
MFDESDVAAVADVVRSGEWGRIGGHRVVAFEQAFAAFQGATYCLGLNSGGSALQIALQALRLPRGAEVIVSPYTYAASATEILNAGLVPVFVDMDPDTYNLDPERIEGAITTRTAAIMPVHFGGLACDMGAIMAIAARHGLRVIEDAAHAHGATWLHRGLGTIGDAGCFSFQASKNLNAGEGGAILTNDATLFERAIDYHDLWA